MEQIFPFVGRAFCSLPNNQAEERGLVQRKAEDCLGLFSEWGTTLLAWNQGEATTLSKPPSAAFHASLLVGTSLCAQHA